MCENFARNAYRIVVGNFLESDQLENKKEMGMVILK
jgi:hypothetical protein